MTTTPAGWYPDPTLPHISPQPLRYWDGAEWTEHTAPAPAAAHSYAVATANQPTTPDGVPLAGWWWRVLAYLIDSVVLWVVGMVITLPMQIGKNDEINDLTALLEGDQPDFAAFWSGYLDLIRDMMIWQIPVVLLTITYFAVMLRWKGATLGKLAVGLQVRLRDQPGRLPWRAIAWRVGLVQGIGVLPVLAVITGLWPVMLLTSLAMLIFVFVDFLRPAWNDKRQAIHDAAARTNVVKIR